MYINIDSRSHTSTNKIEKHFLFASVYRKGKNETVPNANHCNWNAIEQYIFAYNCRLRRYCSLTWVHWKEILFRFLLTSIVRKSIVQFLLSFISFRETFNSFERTTAISSSNVHANLVVFVVPAGQRSSSPFRFSFLSFPHPFYTFTITKGTCSFET